jgi:beta-mannosidase
VDDHHEGDCHHWMVMRPESKYWSNPWYWDTDDVPIFNSEYGYGGPCSLQSTRQYTSSNTPDLFDATGYQHTNTFYDIPRVNFSIGEHYRDAENLPLEQYILLGGLSQGLNLGYSLESMRANPHTMGGMFWMYNDTWGENGWSIIDYYLRRKISWYNVRRCLAHQRLLLRKGGHVFGGKADEVLLLAINDGPVPLNVMCEWGYLRHDGQTRNLISLQATVMSHSHTVIGTIPMPSEAMLQMGTVVVIPTTPANLEPASLLHAPYKQWHLPEASLQITDINQKHDGLHVTVTSNVYAHAVHLNVPDGCNLSDHYFMTCLQGCRARWSLPIRSRWIFKTCVPTACHGHDWYCLVVDAGPKIISLIING